MSRVETIGDATLYLGDCREILPTLGKVDAVVTDPPYFLPAAHYSVRTGSSKSLGDLSIVSRYFGDLFAEVGKAIGPNGVAYFFCDGQSYPIFYVGAYSVFKKIRPLVWDKLTAINGYGWRHQHEIIMFCEMENAPRIPTGDGDVIRLRSEPIEDREHLAQKPVNLIELLIEKSAPLGATVLDPFMGSGTAAVACANTGRKFIGIEIEPKYFDIACKRIEEAWKQPRLFEEPKPKAEQLSLIGDAA